MYNRVAFKNFEYKRKQRGSGPHAALKCRERLFEWLSNSVEGKILRSGKYFGIQMSPLSSGLHLKQEEVCLTGTEKLQGMEEQARWDYAAIKGEVLKI